MDRPNVDRRNGNGMELDYNTAIRPEESRSKRIMERQARVWRRAAALSGSLIFFMSIPKMILLSGILSTISANPVVGLLYMLIVSFCYVISFQKGLLWWLRKGFRPWYTLVCVGIFNLKHAWATFLMKPSVRTYGELKHFEWTCRCGRIFDDTVSEHKVLNILSFKLKLENAGFQAKAYQLFRLSISLIVDSLILGPGMFCVFQDRSNKIAAVVGEANASSQSLVDTGATSDMLGKEHTGLPPHTLKQTDISSGLVTGEPITASYTGVIGVEQGWGAPRDENSPPSPQIEPEDAPPHSEHVLLLIKHGRHRMKYLSANLQGKWTDRDTFSQIKEHYDRFKNSWWYLKTLSHVEFKKVRVSRFISQVITECCKFYIYHSDHVDIADREREEVPVCEKICDRGCGMGCLGYQYTPPRVEMIPPIPRKAMLHFLESPDCLGISRRNRAALPKRRKSLKLGDRHLKTGWGLQFKEKVWSLPIVTVQFLSIISAILVTVCWTLFHEKSIASLVPGVFILLIGQSIAALLQRWAESNFDEEPKA